MSPWQVREATVEDGSALAPSSGGAAAAFFLPASEAFRSPELMPVPTTTTTLDPNAPASLFCVAVVRVAGGEPSLLEAQRAKRAGIFLCDEYQVYSDSGAISYVKYDTVDLHADRISMGNMGTDGTTTSSWLNTAVFMRMWDQVVADGRWWQHDWTVKVDPDAVFFASRLRFLLTNRRQELTGRPVYIGNCDRSWNNEPRQLKLFGSLEVFSKDAIGAYKAFGQSCQEKLPWKGWGEDYYMQHCLETIGVHGVNGTQLLGDERCYAAPCTDVGKVAFHDFKAIDDWMGCWDASKEMEEQIVFKKK